MTKPEEHWWPLATAEELSAREPLSRQLHGVQLVVFRDGAGRPAALHDRCPHRHAPLSRGKVCNGELACPYHGWRFDGAGRCTRVPGIAGVGIGASLVPALETRVAHGLIWGCFAHGANTPALVAPSVDDGVDAFFMVDTANCSVAAAAENLLDASHTPFVHAGLIRRDSRRQQVKAEVRALPDGIEVRYSEEDVQSGLVSKLLEGSRTESFGRFRLPGVAEIEYRGRDGLNLLATAWLVPEDIGRLRVYVRIATRAGWTPAWLKRIILSRLFGLIFRQDKEILEATHANIKRFEAIGLNTRVLDSPVDLLGPSIRRLLAGDPLETSTERVVSLCI